MSIRLRVGPTTYTATQLMELGKTETLGIEDDHDGGIGHVDTHFDDCGGYKNLRFAAHKLLHLLFFVGWFHLAVHLAETKFREYLAHGLEAFLQITQVDLLAFLDEGIDDIHLASLLDLLADALVERRHLRV